MSARDVIREALTLGVPKTPTQKADIVLSALHAAGYRLLGPLPEGTLAKHGSVVTIEFYSAESAMQAFDALESAMPLQGGE